jgi:ABC-type lipoprotein release transport system permease subunit
VTRLFAVEAALLSAGACVAGLVATLAITVTVNGFGASYNAGINSEPIPLRIAIVPSTWLTAGAFLMAVAILAAWHPARRAARARIPDALAFT